MIRRLLAALLLLCAATGAAAWYVLRRPPQEARWLGYADADYVKVAPTALGRLVSVNVARGDLVAAGTLLFAQDDADDLAARDQARAARDEAAAKLADLEAPGRNAEIIQAEAEVADMRAAHERVARDLARAEAIVTTGATSRQNVDQLRGETLSAAARVQSAQAKLALMADTSGRAQAIVAQQAAVAAARAQLVSAQWRLDQRRATAPAAGRIADTYARPGETIPAGTPVVSLLPPENILVRFFVPETALARLAPGQKLAIACDSCPPGLVATISFMATAPEYTPPVIYSQGSRGSLVYLIEARPDPAQRDLLKPGQPVDVTPPPGAPAQ